VSNHKKVYANYFGIGPDDASPCERCILLKELGRGTEVRRSVDIHHCDMKGMGGSDSKDFIENLGGCCRKCHNELHASPEENKLFALWCKELKARALVMRAMLFAEL